MTTNPPGIIASYMFGYVPGSGYASPPTLDLGMGYWIKVSANGKIIFPGAISPACSTLRVFYGGSQYHTIKIGSQCWLEENLNVGAMITGVTDQTANATLEKYCYNDDLVSCNLYGAFYQWNEAMQYVTTPGTQGICPPGWHIPTLAEFQTLSTALGGDGNALKAVGEGTAGGAGTNTSGFSALLAGYRSSSGSFASMGGYASLWSSTESDALNVSNLYLNDGTNLIDLNVLAKEFGFRVRCLQD